MAKKPQKYDSLRGKRPNGHELVPKTHYSLLTPMRQRLVDEYLKDLNGKQAGIRAGYGKGASVYPALNSEPVQLALKERREQMAGDRAINGASHVINKLWDIETADPRELVEVWKIPCRYCWGTKGRYQFSKMEQERRRVAYRLGQQEKPLEAIWPRGPADEAAWQAGSSTMPFDPQGGDGYTMRKPPNPDCGECAGDGITLQHVHDTRELSPQALALYRGVNWKNGKMELVMAGQDAARDQLAKLYGVAVDRKKILVRHLNPDDLTDEELLRAVAELEAMANAAGIYEIVDAPPVKLTRPT